MGVVLIGSAAGHAAGDTATTGTFDATGATLLWAVMGTYWGSDPTLTFSDSGGNTWRKLTKYKSGNVHVCIAYAYDKAGGALSLSATQTVTIADAFAYTYVFGGAVSGTASGAGVLIGSAGASDDGLVTGNVTPSQLGDYLLTAVASSAAGTPACATGFTIRETETDSANYTCGAVADRVVASVAAQGGTWSGVSGNTPCAIVVFAMASGATGTGSASFDTIQVFRAACGAASDDPIARASWQHRKRASRSRWG